MILRWIERSDDRNRFFASCWVMVEPPCTTSLARAFSTQGAGRADEVDAEVLEEAPVLGGERGLDQMVGDLLQRHGVVVQDAALADLVAVAIEEFDAYLPVRMLALRRTPCRAGMASDIQQREAAERRASSPSEKASLRRRFQPLSRKRAKKLVMPFQRSFAPSQVSAREESIQASTRSQSMGPLRPPCLKNQSCTFQASYRSSRRTAALDPRGLPPSPRPNQGRNPAPRAQSLSPSAPAARVERSCRLFWPNFWPSPARIVGKARAGSGQPRLPLIGS